MTLSPKVWMNHTGCLLQGQNTGYFLRQDNADERLTERAIEIGLADEERIKVYNEKKWKLKTRYLILFEIQV